MLQIKTSSDLRYAVEQAGDTHFFDRGTMRFFGDTMRNYGVRRVTVISNFDVAGNYHEQGVERDVYELYRRKAVKHGNRGSAYFSATTFQRVYSIVPPA